MEIQDQHDRLTLSSNGITACMDAGPPRWARLLLSVVWCAALVSFAADRYNYQAAFLSEFFCWALFTSIVIHLRLRPSLGDAGAILGLTALLIGLDHFLLKL